jgi:hypothetical protein
MAGPGCEPVPRVVAAIIGLTPESVNLRLSRRHPTRLLDKVDALA